MISDNVSMDMGGGGSDTAATGGIGDSPASTSRRKATKDQAGGAPKPPTKATKKKATKKKATKKKATKKKKAK